MSALAIKLFARVGVDLDGQELTEFRTQKVRALLILLAAEPHMAHRRETLMTLLWPGMPDSSARQNLRQVLFHLRRAVPDLDPVAPDKAEATAVPLLIADRQTIRLNPAAALNIDTARFDALLAQTLEHEHLDLFTCHTCYERLNSAVALYDGDFLADLYLDDSNEFEDWAAQRRQAYRRQALDALETLATIAMRRLAYLQARGYAERQLALDNLRESAYRQLMEILALNGRRSDALALYETCRRVLAEELSMAPTARTTELYEQIRAGKSQFDLESRSGVRGYELHEEIGAGAHGVILRAVQATIGREVAVKIIGRRFANDPAFIRRFEAEAQTVARLEHPHIVPLYDYWREPGGAYLVMRLLRGGNLLDALAGGPWPPERTQILLDQIAAALSAAHLQGIVHRDIKPANILFDESGNAYLSDFGIAKDLSGDAVWSKGEGLLGTPDYISPEQLREEPITAQTDIYSLGTVLYEVLSGQKPFANMPAMAVLQSQLTAELPRLSEQRPDLPPGIDGVIQRATAKRPSDRFAEALEMAEAFREALTGVVAMAPAPSSPPANPYKGLAAYQEADAADFFGREALAEKLAQRLATTRFLAVVGPSGSGKSSVVMAGLLPLLRSGTLPGSEHWFIAKMVPGSAPLQELGQALWPIAVDPPPNLLDPLSRDTGGLLRTVRRILPSTAGAQLLLIIDQFEELFTQVEDEQERQFFVESLLAALDAPDSPLRVLVTLRADFYDRPLQIEALAGLFQNNTELVLPLQRVELARAISKPVHHAGVQFEEGVVPTIVADAAGQPGALPLLQYALTELFARQDSGVITNLDYASIGGVAGALSKRADALYNSLPAHDQEMARQLFLRLVTPGEGGEYTRRRVRLTGLSDLASAALPNGSDPRSIIELFGAARLLTFDHDPLTREPTVEVAHEALLHEWERLSDWLEESRDDIRRERALAASTAEWEAAGRDEGYLLRGARLSEAELWQEETYLVLSQSERDFLSASTSAKVLRDQQQAARLQRELETARHLAESEAQRAAEQQHAAQRLRRRAIFLAGSLAAALILALISLYAWQQAGQNAALAMRHAAESQSLALAAGAQAALAAEDTEQALALALAASQIGGPPAAAQEALYQAAVRSGAQRLIAGGGGWRWAMDVAPDGRTIASGADDMAVTLWDLESGEEIQRLAGEHSDSIGDVAFTPDGRRLLSGAYDDTLVLWDLDRGQVVQRMENPSGDVNGLTVAPDGRVAAAATEGGVVTLWDLAHGTQIGELVHNPDVQVLPVAFSPDGRLLASGSEDGTVVVWDVARRREMQRLPVLDDVVFAVAFSPDGQVLAAGGKGEDVSLIDLPTGELIATLDGLPDWLFDLAFSPDGAQLLGASRDGALLLWDVDGRRLLRAMRGEAGRTLSVDFVDQDTAVSSASTGNVRVWSLADGGLAQETRAADGLVSVDQSADGRKAVLGLNQAVRLIDMPSGEIEHEFALPGAADPVVAQGDITALALNPTADRLLAGTDDGTLVLWDSGSGREVARLQGHDSRVHDLAFSPDGRMFLSAADDRRAVLWDTATGEVLWQATNPTDTINAVAFSPDGRFFATGAGTFRFPSAPIDPDEVDYSVTIWDTGTRAEIARLDGHEGPVMTLAFSPDSRSLLSGSLDTSLLLWDVAGTELRQRLAGHTSGVMSAAFSKSGRYVASGAQDGSVLLWDLPDGGLLRRIRGHEGVVQHISFAGAEDMVWSAAEDGWIRQWNLMPDLPALLDWTRANRYVPQLPCDQYARYGLDAEACVAATAE